MTMASKPSLTRSHSDNPSNIQVYDLCPPELYASLSPRNKITNKQLPTLKQVIGHVIYVKEAQPKGNNNTQRVSVDDLLTDLSDTSVSKRLHKIWIAHNVYPISPASISKHLVKEWKLLNKLHNTAKEKRHRKESYRFKGGRTNFFLAYLCLVIIHDAV